MESRESSIAYVKTNSKMKTKINSNLVNKNDEYEEDEFRNIEILTQVFNNLDI